MDNAQYDDLGILNAIDHAIVSYSKTIQRTLRSPDAPDSISCWKRCNMKLFDRVQEIEAQRRCNAPEISNRMRRDLNAELAQVPSPSLR